MHKVIIVIILFFSSAFCDAQDQNPVKLQCEGTYSNFSKHDKSEIPIKGIYIEILRDRMTVLGAPGFDATYSVTNRPDNGLGIQLDSNKSFEGFLNRFSGELSLVEKGKVAKDGSFKIRQLINAVCHKASALF